MDICTQCVEDTLASYVNVSRGNRNNPVEDWKARAVDADASRHKDQQRDVLGTDLSGKVVIPKDAFSHESNFNKQSTT